MLRRTTLLLAATALALAAGCGRGTEPTGSEPADSSITTGLRGEHAGDGHAGMACAACHTGARADSGLATVPRATCTSSNCHEDGGPPTVQAGSISFPHRDHGQRGDVDASCAGCHDHHSGEEPLHVEVDACALCHVSAVSGEESTECRMCHQQPNHVALTSQALPIPHSSIPWVETGCVRCHYDVSRPPVKVSTEKCAACHTDLQRVIAAGIGDNLHPRHEGVSCTRCHQTGLHRVQAMSSAVSLVCADCHITAHQLQLPTEWAAYETCGSCHPTVHQAQQQLVLGTPTYPGATASPSTKFLAGITCRSCHIRPLQADTAQAAIRGQAEACAACHRNEYRQVLDWWIDGSRARARTMRTFAERASADLRAEPDTVRRLVASAQAMVQLVETAGGQHNLELADRIFRDSRSLVLNAYRVAGRPAPPAPNLGTTAHEGLCTYCHYTTQGDLRLMPADFHEEAMRRSETR